MGGVDRPLYVGTNAIGRQSGDDIQNQHLVEDLREEYCGSVLQLAGRGVSSKHAVICESDTMRRVGRLLLFHRLLSSAQFPHRVKAVLVLQTWRMSGALFRISGPTMEWVPSMDYLLRIAGVVSAAVRQHGSALTNVAAPADLSHSGRHDYQDSTRRAV